MTAGSTAHSVLRMCATQLRNLFFRKVVILFTPRLLGGAAGRGGVLANLCASAPSAARVQTCAQMLRGEVDVAALTVALGRL